MNNLEDNEPLWHKICYSSFTSKQNVQTVTKRTVSADSDASTSTIPLAPEGTATHRDIQKVNWKKSIFCQSKKLEAPHQVQSMEVEKVIKHIAIFNYKVKCRIGENDLIAYEAHYHNSCKYKESKEHNIHRSGSQDKDAKICQRDPIVWNQLLQSFDSAFDQGHVYTMDHVYAHYCQLVSIHDKVDPVLPRVIEERLQNQK